jgi:hypothetical protein
MLTDDVREARDVVEARGSKLAIEDLREAAVDVRAGFVEVRPGMVYVSRAKSREFSSRVVVLGTC